MNKRGTDLMTKTLLVMVITIIVFVPACSFVSNVLFRLSDQAKENFITFSQELNLFANSEKDKEDFMLIMDEDTGIVIFTDKNNKEEIYYTKERGGDIESNHYYLPYPESVCKGIIPCACLCRSFDEANAIRTGSVESDEIAIGGHGDATNNYDISCNSLTCQELTDVTLAKSWTQYRTSDSNEKVYFAPSNRRFSLHFSKENNKIIIS